MNRANTLIITAVSALFAQTIWAADPRENLTQAPADATAQDQAEKTDDAALTHKIRQELMLSPLSVEGKNVTIMAAKGVVSLRGTVPTEQEKRTIEQAARKYAKSVHSEIAVRQ